MGVLFFGDLFGDCDPASFAQSFSRRRKASGEYLGTQHFLPVPGGRATITIRRFGMFMNSLWSTWTLSPQEYE